MSQFSLDAGKTMQVVRVSAVAPLSRRAEFIYFALLVYSIMGSTWGLSVPLLGAGGMALLSMYGIWRARKDLVGTYLPLLLPIGCAMTSILIQVLGHDNGIMQTPNREFITWTLTLIVIYSLLLRDGFLHRFAATALFIGFLVLPYLVLNYGGARSERAGLEHSLGLANPNDLAAWFGFCCVYCAVVAIETRRNLVRVGSLLVASGCLFVVGLTVSRTALLAIVISLVIACRRLLKRGFLPVLLMAIVASGVFYSGVFDESIGLYVERGTEETGRLLVWPLAIERLLESPLIGVGVDNVDTYVALTGKKITPHNSFLYIGLSSGIVPLFLFLLYWFKAVKGAYDLSSRGLQNAAFQLPLTTYTLITLLSSAGAFMYSWAIVALINAVPRRPGRIFAFRLRKREASESAPYQIPKHRSYVHS